MYRLVSELFPINRSITGNGTRKTLSFLSQILPEMNIFEIPSGTKVFDWIVPDEWNVNEAWIKDEEGKKIIDFSHNNLHLMGYSTPIKKTLCLEELQNHLFSLPDQPNAIPYITAYYNKGDRWGFCLKDNDRKQLRHGNYDVYIDSVLTPGHLTYGEVVLPGKEDREVLISTYICHPSMANNELSGPVVAISILDWLKKQKERKYTYRAVFIPETIGSLVYLDKHFKHLKEKLDAGFVLTCIGDNNSYSMLESRYGKTLADKVAKHVLKYHFPNFNTYSFLERGSDERQYCAPGFDLPVCSLMRTKYSCYPEYHTSLDNLDFISPEGLYGGFCVVQKCIMLLEKNHTYKTKILGEPQLGKRGLYPTISTKATNQNVRRMMNLIAYSDGTKDLIDIAETIGENCLDLIELAEKLVNFDILDILQR
ncbi:MAG: DUF4910 domain-containing protein [Oligoflexia bacterium]|nr:DUF4910 domain-containing protein [Oligoflexia bacterium]